MGDYFNQKFHHKGTTHYTEGGVCHNFIFSNGFGAMVLRNPWTGGYERGLWTVKVSHNGKDVYDTPIHVRNSSHTLSWLTEETVEQYLQEISEFPMKIRKFA